MLQQIYIVLILYNRLCILVILRNNYIRPDPFI